MNSVGIRYIDRDMLLEFVIHFDQYIKFDSLNLCISLVGL